MKILVAVKSCHKHSARRQAMMETWLPQLDAEFVFVLGLPHVVADDVLSCTVSDAFSDIAPKIWSACLYARESNVDFMFVCDDDTYVRPERLLKSDFEKHDYCGFLRTSGLDYNGNIPYAQGSAYWLSTRAIAHVLKSKVMVPGIIDDGAVGRALINKVPFVHDYRYEPGPQVSLDRVPHESNNLISCHKCLPDTMRQVHWPWRLK